MFLIGGSADISRMSGMRNLVSRSGVSFIFFDESQHNGQQSIRDPIVNIFKAHKARQTNTTLSYNQESGTDFSYSKKLIEQRANVEADESFFEATKVLY
jgi:hypothetical protein